MAKKITGWIVTGIAAVIVIFFVYQFVTKGYSGKGTNLNQTLPSQSSSPTPNSQENGNVTSSKISLVVSSPTNGANLTSTNVTVKGKTSPNAEVFVNDQSGKADSLGNFAISLGLDEGQNTLVVSANDAEGNATQQDLSVNVASF